MKENTNITEFSSEIEKAFQTAWHSEKGGDDNWNKLLKYYGADPLSHQEKEQLLNSEMKIARGAFPVELRRVYQKITDKHLQKNNPQLNDVLKNFDIEVRVKEYYQKIKPFSGMSDIFSNASTSLKKYSEGMQKEKHHTIKCKSCGAPRLEEMQYDSCLFCGSKLFESI
ncbi:MAG TPA: hypothetical protein PKC91_11525 [Ignavibacteria bacterium]|nr:hypothetical protein [Ignavibacteria bacterium]